MARRNRLSPLDEARSLGDVLSLENVHRVTAEKVVKEYSFHLYWKPRAQRYRKLWAASAMRGYDSRERIK